MGNDQKETRWQFKDSDFPLQPGERPKKEQQDTTISSGTIALLIASAFGLVGLIGYLVFR